MQQRIAEAVKTTVITGRRTNNSERFTPRSSQLLLLLPESEDFAGLLGSGGAAPGAPPGGLAGAPSSTCTLPPGWTVSCPVTTTPSPSDRALVTTTSSPCRWPRGTLRNSAVSASLTE